jgi:predicted ATPase/DNA-binding CsgD family transcriptional regulator/DNA-binding XRE family transcriptional regulator
VPDNRSLEFSQLLRQYRSAAGLTQDQLSVRSGLSARAVSDLERGLHRAPRRDTLKRLGEALSLQGSDLERFVSSSEWRVRTSHPGAAATRSAVPVALTSFVGREQEVERLEAMFNTTRLLTLVGTGGVGKTRLALRLACQLAEHFDGSVCVTELSALAEPDLVPQVVASALGIAEHQGRTALAALTETLRERRLLLVLDNCEHLVEACAQLVQVLLRAGPALRILATSREPLGVDGERTFSVPPLSLGETDGRPESHLASDAVRLFVERAYVARPDLEVGAHNAEVIAGICRAVEGLPLALELAAARLRVLEPEELLERLRQGLSVLAGRNRSAPERQRTMQAAVEWSYHLLDERERRLFERLSVFAGGWTLDAAEAVCAGYGIEAAEILDLLTSLVDKSLVMVEPHAAQARYRLLEPLRQYAVQRLAAIDPQLAPPVRAQHADFLLALARRSFAPVFEGTAAELHQSASQRPGWLERLDREHDNVRAALSWLIENGNVTQAQRMGAAFWLFWAIRGHLTEGGTWMRRILDLPGGDDSIRIRVLIGAGILAFFHDDLASARRYDEKALDLAQHTGDETAIAIALFRLGEDARARGDFADAHLLQQEALDRSRAIDNPAIEAHCCFGLGNLGLAEGDLVAARDWLSEALARFRALGNRRHAAIAARRLGVAMYRLGDQTAGRSLLEEALAGLRTAGDRLQAALTLWELGAAATGSGDHSRARELLSEGLRLARDLGDRGRVCWYLQAFAQLAAVQGQSYRAVLLGSAAYALGDSIRDAAAGEGRAGNVAGWQWSVMGLSSIAGDDSVLASQLRSASERLGELQAAEARDTGRHLTAEEIVDYALTTETSVKVARSHRSDGPLTERERQVVALIVRGLTNREVAEELVIAEGTAVRHVANILNKLGLRSRAQVAVWAVAAERHRS